MPYPHYTRMEKMRFFFSDFVVYLPLMLHITCGANVAIAAVILGYYNVIGGWLASPLALAGWGYMNYMFWCYQAWRSSGTRGRFVNPSGPSSADMQSAFVWLLIGVFIHLYHMWLRSRFRMRRLHKKIDQ